MRFQFAASLNCAQPFAGHSSDRVNFHSPVHWRRMLDLQQTGAEQRFHAYAIAARMVMKCGGNLDQPLQKPLVRLACGEPYRLPCLMRLEEFPRIEELDPVRYSQFLRGFI